MISLIIRTALFNILFYFFTALACILALPALVMPKKAIMRIIRSYVHINYFLERTILRLDYRIEGLENLPENGTFILAAKHQSTYETLKLHILFDDPAIILKKELLKIPLWGNFLKKTDVIAIDRSSREEAMKSITEGAKRMKKQGRPIVIFPQGTRVSTDASPADKPYKFGVAKIQEATHLPIIPLALNAGYFYPRHRWLKRPGTVTFSFLKPIKPFLKRQRVMNELQEQIETKSDELLIDAEKEFQKVMITSRKQRFKFWLYRFPIALLAGVIVAYSYSWFEIKNALKEQYQNLFINDPFIERSYQNPRFIGFPGPITLKADEEFLQTAQGFLRFENLEVSGWPLPATAVRFKAGPVTTRYFRYQNPFVIDQISLSFTPGPDMVTIQNGNMRFDDGSDIAFEGTVANISAPYPDIDLILKFQNHEQLMQTLANDGFVEKNTARFISAAFESFRREDGVIIPLTLQNRAIFIGPVRILTLPENGRLMP